MDKLIHHIRHLPSGFIIWSHDTIVFRPDDITSLSKSGNEFTTTNTLAETLSHETPSDSALRFHGPIPALHRSAYILSNSLIMSSWNQSTNRDKVTPITLDQTAFVDQREPIREEDEDDMTWDGDDSPNTLYHEDIKRESIAPATDAKQLFSYDFKFDNLPDSFAPLISSSNMEILRHHLMIDLLQLLRKCS
jgi:hypothetical protein